MAYLFRLLVLLAVLTPMTGCYFAAGLGKAPWKKHEQALAAAEARADPAIRGTWSEPVNGVRMMAIPLASAASMNDRRVVLIYAQNASDEPVSLPTMRASQMVTPLSHRGSEGLSPDPDANLRLEFELIGDKQVQHASIATYQQELLKELAPQLMPGEIRVYAILLNRDPNQLQHALDQLRQDEVPVSEVYWFAEVQDSTIARLYLSYRPEGFGPKHMRQRLEMKQWRGKQIDLPRIEIMLRPHTGEQSSQQLNE